MYCVRKDGRNRLLYTVQAPAYAASYSDGLYWLELAGPEQACRAIWAHVVKRRAERNTVATNAYVVTGTTSEVVRVDPTERYHSAMTPRGMVIFHRRFNRLCGDLLLGGDEEDPSPWFRLSFQRLVDIPVLPGWMAALWKAGVSRRLITPPDTMTGVTVWKMKTASKDWEKLIKELLKGGEIDG